MGIPTSTSVLVVVAVVTTNHVAGTTPVTTTITRLRFIDIAIITMLSPVTTTFIVRDTGTNSSGQNGQVPGDL